MDVTGIDYEQLILIDGVFFIIPNDVHGAVKDIEDLQMIMPVAWNQLGIRLINMKINRKFGIIGDDFMVWHRL